MEDEVFEVGGRLLSATKFHPTDAVRIVDGYVEKAGRGREPLAEFFNQWLALQSATFVVTVGPSRKEELAALLSQHGFAFEMTPDGPGPS